MHQKSTQPVHGTNHETQNEALPVSFPFDIHFVDCEPSEAVRFQIEEQLAKLSRFCDRLTTCRVAVRIPHKHSLNRFFHIHILLDLPGKRLAVSREPEARGEHTSIKVAIRDAFHKLTRRLEDFLNSRHDLRTAPPTEDNAKSRLDETPLDR